MQIRDGNLLDATEDVIIQQCNCITQRGYGLSASITDRFPYADVYSKRPLDYKETPGEVILCGDGGINRYVACLMGQFYPGKGNQFYDTYEMRRQWIHDSLWKLGYHMLKTKLKTIAAPYLMGCSLAGDNWEQHEAIFKGL